MSKRPRSSHILYDPAEAEMQYPAIAAFADIPVSCATKTLVNSLTKNFSGPTPVQSHSWPLLFAGKDVIAVAKTGSGKTVAFGIPALAICEKLKPKKTSPYILVLAPTRELAMQTAEVLNTASTSSEFGGVKVCCLFGGAPKHEQRDKLVRASIIVATPGRLVDMVQEGSLTLNNVKMFVLDEADRMLDLGFEPEVRKIAGWIKTDREDGDMNVQTAMYTATWPKTIQNLAATFLKKEKGSVVRLVAGSEGQDVHADEEEGEDRGPRANTSVTQHVSVIDNKAKDRELVSLLKKLGFASNKTSGNPRIILFALYKKEAERVKDNLCYAGFTCVSLHGDKTQAERTKAFNAFRDKEVDMLVATDVAARGVDLPNVDHVINYTFPLTIEDYVHRIGRTGRGGSKGDSWTFFTVNEKGLAGQLVTVLKDANQEVPQDMYQFSMAVKRKKPEDPPIPALGTTSGTKIQFGSDSDDE